VDADTRSVTDARAYEALLNGVWASLQLTSSTGAGDRVTSELLNYENGKRAEYDQYWQLRNALLRDPVTQAPTGLALTEDEIAFYTARYADAYRADHPAATQPEVDAFVAGQLDALRAARFQTWQALDADYGQYGDMY